MLSVIFIGFESEIEDTSVELGRLSEIYALAFN